VSFKNKVGPVQDISFSTRKPAEVIKFIHEKILAQKQKVETTKFHELSFQGPLP